jgi:hypothetical protein
VDATTIGRAMTRFRSATPKPEEIDRGFFDSVGFERGFHRCFRISGAVLAQPPRQARLFRRHPPAYFRGFFTPTLSFGSAFAGWSAANISRCLRSTCISTPRTRLGWKIIAASTMAHWQTARSVWRLLSSIAAVEGVLAIAKVLHLTFWARHIHLPFIVLQNFHLGASVNRGRARSQRSLRSSNRRQSSRAMPAFSMSPESTNHLT